VLSDNDSEPERPVSHSSSPTSRRTFQPCRRSHLYGRSSDYTLLTYYCHLQQPSSRQTKRQKSLTPHEHDRQTPRQHAGHVLPLPSRLPTATPLPNGYRSTLASHIVTAAQGSRQRVPPLELVDLTSQLSTSNTSSTTSLQRQPHTNGVSQLRRHSRPQSRDTSPQRTYPIKEQKPPTLAPFTVNIPQRPVGKSTPPPTKAVPDRSSNIQVVVASPLSKSNKAAAKKKTWKQLIHSTALAEQDPVLVENFFGQTGFSKAFSTEDTKQQVFMRNAASKKHRRAIDRAHVQLEVESIAQAFKGLEVHDPLTHPSQTGLDTLSHQFREQVDPPLTFSNDIDQKRLHGKFQLVNRYIIGDKVRPAPPSTNRGCKCSDCDLMTCPCFTQQHSDMPQQIRTYERRSDGLVVLSDEYMTNMDMWFKYDIIECNENCGCGPSCVNRVIVKGRTLPLQIYNTRRYGLGVRSPQNIVRGQFIEVYLGEVVTLEEMTRREEAENEGDPSYVYSLDRFSTTNMHTTYHVDGKYFGTAMRFVNHSCNPNARCFSVLTHKEDHKVYYLAFFALRDIPAGSEILIDYNGKGDGLDVGPLENKSDKADIDTIENNDGRVKCQCGATNCRKFLWPAAKARRRRRRRQAG
jgi:[histone H3]-lysine9 N-trimethyltransferase SUV39H